MRVQGFHPIAHRDALALILGTIPGRDSLDAGEYYANRANAFWFIMGQLFGAGPELDYRERTETLIRNRIAVWDVLRSAQREGSSDAKIVRGSEEANHFDEFFRLHLGIRAIFFNGEKAQELYGALVVPTLRPSNVLPRSHTLPSTSPANTDLTREEKLEAWQLAKHVVLDG